MRCCIDLFYCHIFPPIFYKTPFPVFYFENTIFLFPAISSSTASSSSIVIRGYTSVDDYGGAGSETLPDELQHFCLDYCLSCAYCKAGKHSLSALHMQKFIQNCMLHRRDVYNYVDVTDPIDRTRIPDVTVQVGQQG